LKLYKTAADNVIDGFALMKFATDHGWVDPGHTEPLYMTFERARLYCIDNGINIPTKEVSP